MLGFRRTGRRHFELRKPVRYNSVIARRKTNTHYRIAPNPRNFSASKNTLRIAYLLLVKTIIILAVHGKKTKTASAMTIFAKHYDVKRIGRPRTLTSGTSAFRERRFFFFLYFLFRLHPRVSFVVQLFAVYYKYTSIGGITMNCCTFNSLTCAFAHRRVDEYDFSFYSNRQHGMIMEKTEILL